MYPLQNAQRIHLEGQVPPAHLALFRAVAAAAESQGMPLYVVGGYVRDLLLKRPSLDFDLVVEGDAIALARALRKKYGGRVVAHRKFGTAKWEMAAVRERLAQQLASLIHEGQTLNPADFPESLDLVTARTEHYPHPAALPVVSRGSIKDDLHRRDFTINTLAVRLDGDHEGELLDYWGGLDDLEQGLIRVLHDQSFVDDPTRMLRAVRFEQRFGFTIEPRTLQWLAEARGLLAQVSGDRIRHELDAMLDEPRAEAMLARSAQLGLLEAIHPPLRWRPAVTERLRALQQAPWPPPAPWDDLPAALRQTPLRRALAYALWWMDWPEDEIKVAARRLRFPKVLTEVVHGAAALASQARTLAQANPSAFTFQVEAYPLASAYALYLAAENENLRARLRRYAAEWRHIRARTTGRDLQALGIPRGPRYKEILQTLRAAWIDGEVRSPEGEKALLARLVMDEKEGNKDTERH